MDERVDNENEDTRKNIKWKAKRRLEEKIREDDLERSVVFNLDIFKVII